MLFDYKYSGTSSVTNSSQETKMNFVPDLLRTPTFFSGKLNKKVAFREAISALHDVVVSDLRFKPKDKTAYKEWVTEQEQLWLAEYIEKYQIDEIRVKIERLKKELKEIQHDKEKVLAPFRKAQKKYFDYLYQKDRDAWFVLDPVITIHPDELFFECFSQDESSYGKLSCNYNVFTGMGELNCGTTNIDYSAALYGEFQKIRSYKETELIIDPSGFETKTTNEEAYKEVKIDLPESWVRGFLQVSSAMTLPSVSFDLHPMDIFSICQFLRRFKEKEGPRGIRFILEPDKPIRIIFEPWYKEIICHRSVYKGLQADTIRIWGRRRLMILERLIPVTHNFKVILLGTGLPSFFLAEMEDMTFTLGLSGWTSNDWSHTGQFDLMAPRGVVENRIQKKIFNELKNKWYETSGELAASLNLDPHIISSALTSFTQAGKVIYDLQKEVYRIRELSREPFDMESLRFSSKEETLANELIDSENVRIRKEVKNDILHITGEVKTLSNTYMTLAVIDKDHRLINGSCECDFFRINKFRKGPCGHILATRICFERQRK